MAMDCYLSLTRFGCFPSTQSKALRRESNSLRGNLNFTKSIWNSGVSPIQPDPEAQLSVGYPKWPV